MVLSTNQDSSSSREGARADGEVGDRVAVGVHARDDRLLDALRQIHAHLGDRIAHVRNGPIDRRADLELDEDARLALDGERGDVVDVADAGDRRLDLLHDLGLDLLRRGARLSTTSTSTPGKEMSGLSVIGRRMNDTSPMKSSTTNSTTGVTGCRIAHADMFFMMRPYLALASVGDATRDLFTIAQESAGGRDDALVAGESRADDRAGVGRCPETRTGRRSTWLSALDDQHVTALAVGQHRRLRQHRALRLVDRNLGACERAGPQRRVGLQRDADVAEARGRIDHGARGGAPCRSNGRVMPVRYTVAA